MPGKRYSNVIGFDDGPFAHQHRGDVPIVGTIFAGPRFDGVLVGRVRRDGANSTRQLISLVTGSRFREHLQLILLNGIALAGFNVVDVRALHRRLQLPVLVVTRRAPDFASIREALLARVPGGRRKWGLIESVGEMEPAEDVYVQRVGLSHDEASQVVRRFALNGHVPEPLRVAHMIAGALVTGESKGRA